MATLLDDLSEAKPARRLKVHPRGRCTACDRLIYSGSRVICEVCQQAATVRMRLEALIEGDPDGTAAHLVLELLDAIADDPDVVRDPHAREAVETGLTIARSRTLPVWRTPRAVREVKDPVLPTDDDLVDMPF